MRTRMTGKALVRRCFGLFEIGDFPSVSVGDSQLGLMFSVFRSVIRLMLRIFLFSILAVMLT